VEATFEDPLYSHNLGPYFLHLKLQYKCFANTARLLFTYCMYLAKSYQCFESPWGNPNLYLHIEEPQIQCPQCSPKYLQLFKGRPP
jgi:DNA-directed RNA polymerase subunit RPC12/RpoP